MTQTLKIYKGTTFYQEFATKEDAYLSVGFDLVRNPATNEGGLVLRFGLRGTADLKKLKIRGNSQYPEYRRNETGILEWSGGPMVESYRLNKTIIPLMKPALHPSAVKSLVAADEKYGWSVQIAAWLNDLATSEGFTVAVSPDELVNMVALGICPQRNEKLIEVESVIAFPNIEKQSQEMPAPTPKVPKKTSTGFGEDFDDDDEEEEDDEDDDLLM